MGFGGREGGRLNSLAIGADSWLMLRFIRVGLVSSGGGGGR